MHADIDVELYDVVVVDGVDTVVVTIDRHARRVEVLPVALLDQGIIGRYGADPRAIGMTFGDYAAIRSAAGGELH